MHDIAGQNDETGIHQMDQQRLMAGSVSGCGDQCNAAVAKYIRITVEQLKMFWSTQELTCESLQLISRCRWARREN
jgi:hypothetical protein